MNKTTTRRILGGLVIATALALIGLGAWAIATAPVTRDPADRPPPSTWCIGSDMWVQSWSGDVFIRIGEPRCPS